MQNKDNIPCFYSSNASRNQDYHIPAQPLLKSVLLSPMTQSYLKLSSTNSTATLIHNMKSGKATRMQFTEPSVPFSLISCISCRAAESESESDGVDSSAWSRSRKSPKYYPESELTLHGSTSCTAPAWLTNDDTALDIILCRKKIFRCFERAFSPKGAEGGVFSAQNLRFNSACYF